MYQSILMQVVEVVLKYGAMTVRPLLSHLRFV